ncbi:hypothetical protein GWK47_035250 [Chionoecetes opilio]|uniref:Uncharacterized protein n=1 Tax=Chionoecetes opilio TaxID=41210 RepID=A0A8J4YFH9_CHIOP|nr:hypothetical protein GWK47_035250 [Chionoecetes opilio]
MPTLILLRKFPQALTVREPNSFPQRSHLPPSQPSTQLYSNFYYFPSPAPQPPGILISFLVDEMPQYARTHRRRATEGVRGRRQRGGLRLSPPIGRQLYTLCVHLLDVRDGGRENVPHPGDAAHKAALVLAARERGPSTASPLVSNVLVLRVAILGGCGNPARCGTPCTCALWNTTSAATSLRCSSESRGLTGSNWAGGSGESAASTNRRARRWMLSSLIVCEAAHDIQERAAYSK